MMLSPQQQTFVGAHRFYVAATEDVNLAVVGCWWNSFRMLYFGSWLLFAVVALAVLYPPSLIILLGFLVVAFGAVMLRKDQYHDYVLDQRMADESWQDSLANMIETSGLIQSCHTRHRAAGNFKINYNDFYKKHRSVQYKCSVKNTSRTVSWRIVARDMLCHGMLSYYMLCYPGAEWAWAHLRSTCLRAYRAANFFAINVKWTAVMVIKAALVLAIYVGAHLVMSGDMHIGVFTSVLTILKAFSSQAIKAVDICVGILKGAVSLSRISKFLNMAEHFEGTQELHHLSIYAEALRKTHQDLVARGQQGLRGRKGWRRGSLRGDRGAGSSDGASGPNPAPNTRRASSVESLAQAIGDAVRVSVVVKEIDKIAAFEDRHTLQMNEQEWAAHTRHLKAEYSEGDRSVGQRDVGEEEAFVSHGRVVDIGMNGKGLHSVLCQVLQSSNNRDLLENHLMHCTRISVHDVSFRYYTRMHATTTTECADHANPSRWIFKNMSMEFEVGRIYEVTTPISQENGGPPHGGKATFLRLLSGALQPTDGFFALPPHYKLITITRQPLLMTGTLEENLTYAMRDKSIVTRQQLTDLCHLLEVEPCLLENELQLYIDEHGFNLCASDCRKIVLIRSLLADPDMLLISHINESLHTGELNKVLELLKAWNTNNGLAGITQTHQWRPRTIVLTGRHTHIVQAHDSFLDDTIELPAPAVKTWVSGPSAVERQQMLGSFIPTAAAAGNVSVQFSSEFSSAADLETIDTIVDDEDRIDSVRERRATIGCRDEISTGI